MIKVEGQQVDRGAVGAEDGERRVWGRGVPSGMGRGLGRGLCPLPRKFLIFCFGVLHFGCNLMHFQNKACTK